ncbi:MAG: shikimate dehydrogenase [Rhodospirillaceae bacterium]|nr:shikimate dehydrogenase [Rhodospirillaceae bacterium]
MSGEKIKKAGVIGWPVDHSLSPLVHGFWLDHFKINGTYERIAVEPKKLERELLGLGQNGFVGVNITVPHKEAALKIVDETDETAARIGAVNTIVVKDGGKLFGLNTDGFGFIENLKAGAPDFNFSKSPAVVLGAGGAARSVIGALLNAGTPEVRIINRSGARAEALAMDLAPFWDGDIAIVPWDHRAAALAEAGLLVNTTTLGMKGQPELEISLDRLDPDAVVNDIVYNPLETKLLKNAKERSNVTVDGIGMLLHQARPGFKLWFGMDAKVNDELRAHVLQALKGVK